MTANSVRPLDALSQRPKCFSQALFQSIPESFPPSNSKLLCCLRSGISVINGMKHELGRILGCILGVALAPVVADGIDKHGTVHAEARSSDRTSEVVILADTGAGAKVPEMETAIGPGRGDDLVVFGMKLDVVDGVDLSDTFLVWQRAMTLEGEGVAIVNWSDPGFGGASRDDLPLVILIHHIHSAPAFDAARGPALAIRGNCDDFCLVLERRILSTEKSRRCFEVDKMELQTSGADNEQVGLCVHSIDAVMAGKGGGRGLLADIPELDGLVPRTSGDNGSGRVGNIHKAGRTDRGVVRANCDLLTRRAIQQVRLLVCSSSEDHFSVLDHFG